MALTPIPSAGAKLRASVLRSLITELRIVAARKTADETINNTSVFQDDDELFVSLEANVVYLARVHIVYNSGATPDFKYAFTLPSGTTAPMWSFQGITTVSAFTYGVASSGGVSGLGGTGADQPVDAFGVVITGSTAGTMQLQWAQETANASNTIVRAGSYLELRRIS